MHPERRDLGFFIWGMLYVCIEQFLFFDPFGGSQFLLGEVSQAPKSRKPCRTKLVHNARYRRTHQVTSLRRKMVYPYTVAWLVSTLYHAFFLLHSTVAGRWTRFLGCGGDPRSYLCAKNLMGLVLQVHG